MWVRGGQRWRTSEQVHSWAHIKGGSILESSFQSSPRFFLPTPPETARCDLKVSGEPGKQWAALEGPEPVCQGAGNIPDEFTGSGNRVAPAHQVPFPALSLPGSCADMRELSPEKGSRGLCMGFRGFVCFSKAGFHCCWSLTHRNQHRQKDKAQAPRLSAWGVMQWQLTTYQGIRKLC